MEQTGDGTSSAAHNLVRVNIQGLISYDDDTTYLQVDQKATRQLRNINGRS